MIFLQCTFFTVYPIGLEYQTYDFFHALRIADFHPIALEERIMIFYKILNVFFFLDIPATSYTMGYNGHGSLQHACPACDIKGKNFIEGVTKPAPGKVWYPASHEGVARPGRGEDFFKGEIHHPKTTQADHKPEPKPKSLFRYESPAFAEPETAGAPKDAATHIFFQKLGKWIHDIPNQVCIDPMHTCEQGVGKRMLSLSLLGTSKSNKAKTNLKFQDLEAARTVHDVLTRGEDNKHVWQRGRLVSRIPRELDAISNWKACEVRVFTQYIQDIILAVTDLKPPNKTVLPHVEESKKKAAKEEGREYAYRGDGLDDKRKDFIYSYIYGHAILDCPQLIAEDDTLTEENKDKSNILLAERLWEMTAKLGEELWGNNFCQITTHYLRHLPSQVRYHKQTLTSMGCWRFESFYRILDDMIRQGNNGLVQFRKRWLEKHDVKGQNLKEMDDILITSWAQVGEGARGVVYNLEREGTNKNNVEMVLVTHYFTNVKPTMPVKNWSEFNIEILNVGQLLGKWRFPLNEGVKRWLRRSEFYEMVEDKKNFTPCLMFKYEGEGFSTPIQHLR